MRRVEIIQIWFENYEYLEIGIEDFEWIRINQVHSCCRKWSNTNDLKEELHACGEVSFQLKSDIRNGRWLALGGRNQLPEGMSPHDGIFFRLQDCKNITRLVLCYDDGSKAGIWTHYEIKFVDVEEGLIESLESVDVGKDGTLTVTILPEREKGTFSMEDDSLCNLDFHGDCKQK